MAKHVSDISTTLKAMKFMSKSRPAAHSLLADDKSRDEQAKWSLPTTKQANSLIECEASLFHYTVIIGRRSFQQFNKELEKNTEIDAKKQKLDEAEENEKRLNISDDEMVERFRQNSSLSGTPPKSVGSISNHNNLKRKSHDKSYSRKSKK